jgi:2OG-Fe(II) oxygenase superfamily
MCSHLTGDMAQIFSNGLYKAPLHRVLANESHERYSAPFFYNPSYEVSVKPLELRQTTNGGLNSIEKAASPSSVSNDHSVASPTTDNNTNTTKILYHECLWGYFRAVRFAGDLTDLGVEIQVEDFLKDGPLNPHIEKQKIFAQQANFKTPFSVETYRPLLQE